MPAFDYKCVECGKVFEVFAVNLTAERDTACPHCKSVDTKKQFSVPNVSGKSRENVGPPIVDDCVSCCSSGSCAHAH